ncbi:hypothetical protein CMUST_09950 [Corynebacterium mustelae]|uniref:Colicin immunity protein / pyocin immunity protein n=1 Tax=Corynebacterium mustelae TaxID=571915 RepID=A0A0G3GYS0_9CORY|nr:hypothetical protein [Corynebacterium mustelae]AKK06306.1 hypothetical protein CMUST_09950 [Corynebacterium mustelae]
MIYTDKISEEEFLAGIRKLQECSLPDEQETQLMDFLESRCSMEISDLIYWNDLTAEEILEEVKKHRPIAL